MDNKDSLINQIINNCVGMVPHSQYQALYNILYATMKPYSIELIGEEENLPMTVDDFNNNILSKYLLQKSIEGKSKATIEMYQYRLNQFNRLINKKLTEVTSDDISLYMAHFYVNNKCSGTTLENIRVCIHGFYSWLCDSEYIVKNPAKNVARIKNDTIKEDPFSITELELIRENCTNQRNRALVEFLIATGCRVSETVSMNRDQIDFTNKYFKVIGKGNKVRTIPINDKAILYIKQYLASRTDDENAMFVTLKKPHRRLSPDAIQTALKTIEASSGVFNIHPHRFRRTLCCNLIDKGMPVMQVAELMGHSDVSTTMIYYSQSIAQIQSNYSKLSNI